MGNERSVWPLVSQKDIEPKWWDEVMGATRMVEKFTDERLTDEEEFTVRAMYHVVRNKPVEEVKRVFEGSLHLDEVVQINHMINDNDKATQFEGVEKLNEFVGGFIEASLEQSSGKVSE